MDERYYRFSDYLHRKYGEKTYKITLNIPASCPNRDGALDTKGCIFCAADGAGHENLSPEMDIEQQWDKTKQLILKKYKANAYIAYFQSFSNTYMPRETFEYYMKKAAQLDGCVALAISTRPDCIEPHHLAFLCELKRTFGVDVCIELGLQSANDHTLNLLNRHHRVEDVVVAAKQIKEAGIELCLHIISSLPWDSVEDVIQAARLASQLSCDSVKLHSLYVPKGTVLEAMVEGGEIALMSEADFIDRTITFLEYLDPNIAVQRLVSRIPEEKSAACNWNKSWWKVLEDLESEMAERDSFQGKRVNNYGKA